MKPATGDSTPPHILLPSGPDIRERLERVSDDPSFRSSIIPRIMELADISFEPTEFVESVETRLTEYAEEHMLGMRVLAFADMESILTHLVDDTEQQNTLLESWQFTVSEKIQQDTIREAELKKAQRGYRQPKFPRKRKKQITKQNYRRR